MSGSNNKIQHVYVVDLEINNNEIQEYAKDGKNLIKLEVNENNGVLLYLSKDAMLGLGEELIRAAYKYNEVSEEHIMPIIKNFATSSYGVFATSDSAEIIVIPKKLGSVKDELDKLNK